MKTLTLFYVPTDFEDTILATCSVPLILINTDILTLFSLLHNI